MPIISVNSTASSAANPATAAVEIQAYDIDANNYDQILVIAIIKIVSAAGSTGQAITINLTIGASTKGFAYTVKAEAHEHYITAIHAAPARDAASTITTQIAAAGSADGNTAVTCQEMIVLGENNY